MTAEPIIAPPWRPFRPQGDRPCPGATQPLFVPGEDIAAIDAGSPAPWAVICIGAHLPGEKPVSGFVSMHESRAAAELECARLTAAGGPAPALIRLLR